MDACWEDIDILRDTWAYFTGHICVPFTSFYDGLMQLNMNSLKTVRLSTQLSSY